PQRSTHQLVLFPEAPITMCVQLSTDLCVRHRRFVKIMKPLLPRKRSSSARINLNRHWNELEELYGETYKTRHFETLLLQNELNDNALNEAREAASTRLQQPPVAILCPLPQDDPMADEDLLTPPATPCLAAKSSCNVLMEDDLADLPLSPGTPQAWEVFSFPPLTPLKNPDRLPL
ncbi:hypothetical protein OTU49_006416, partial [Cherax quadricarinatus]